MVEQSERLAVKVLHRRVDGENLVDLLERNPLLAFRWQIYFNSNDSGREKSFYLNTFEGSEHSPEMGKSPHPALKLLPCLVVCHNKTEMNIRIDNRMFSSLTFGQALLAVQNPLNRQPILLVLLPGVHRPLQRRRARICPEFFIVIGAETVFDDKVVVVVAFVCIEIAKTHI